MKTFKIDSLDLKAVVAYFRDPNGNPNHIYVASELSREEFAKRFDGDYSHDYAQCKPLGFEDWNRDEKFWLGGVVIGNAGGPMAIIRAVDECHAQEILSEDFKCCHLDEEEVARLEAEGLEESIRYNDGGTAYSDENMFIRPVRLIRIDTE